MDIAVSQNINKALDGQKRPSNVILRWLGLFFGFFLVWIFMFVIAPWIQESPAVRPLADFIEETGIDAGALYYTEVEEASEAELHMRHALKYSPEEQ